MTFVPRLRIKEALVSSIAALGLGLLLVTWLGWMGSRVVISRFAEAIEHHVEPLRDLKLLSDQYALVVVQVLHQTRIGRTRPSEAAGAIVEARHAIDRLWKKVLKPMDAGETGVVLRDVEPYRLAADQLAKDAIIILRTGDDQQLNDMLDHRLYPVVEPVMEALNALTAMEIDAVDKDQKELNALQAQLEGVYLAVGAAGLLVVVLAVGIIVIRVARPLGAISETMLALADGHLEAPLRVRHGRDEIGLLAHAVEVFRGNAIQLTDQAEELRIARDQAEEATRAKSSFLALMSHEIRTPMNGVTAMAEMLGQTDLNADQHGMVGIIRSSGEALLAIINDILDFSKIEAGKLDIESIEMSLTDVVEEAAELVAGRAQDKGLQLVIDIAPSVPERLLGDPTRLRQILINLAGNAVKFTEAGSVTLRVSATASPSDNAAILRFEVSDTGIGLTDEQMAKLFQPFQQADSSTSRKFGGTGLGLTISRKLCDMMNGQIGASSVFGEGTTFWFELPFSVAQPEALRPGTDIADARVVAVGFTGANATGLKGILDAAGVQGTAWASYEDDVVGLVKSQALSLGPAPGQRVILLLHAGSFGDGAVEMGRSVLAHMNNAPPAAILAAPRALASTLAEADRVGLFCTLTLPLRRRRVWHALAAALGRASLDDRDAPRDTDATGWEPPSLEEARAAKALILVAEDNPTNQIVIRRMLGQRGYAIEMADNGRVALDLFRAGSYGLVLTDFHMPEMDGFQLTKAIRDAEEGGDQRIPIVALTADALPGTRQQCLDAGMDDYLTKPIDSKALVEVLGTYLPQAKALRRPAAKAVAVAVKAAPMIDIDPAILDMTRLRECFGGNDAEAVGFLAQFLDGVPSMLADAGRALEEGKLPAARDAAHALKGAARSIGAIRLGDLAADLQDVIDDADADSAELLFSLLAPTYDELVTSTAELVKSRSPRA